MTAVLLIVGAWLLAFDVARLEITGVAVLGAVTWLLAAWLDGWFAVDRWVADDETSDRLDRVDREIAASERVGGRR